MSFSTCVLQLVGMADVLTNIRKYETYQKHGNPFKSHKIYLHEMIICSLKGSF